MMDALVATLAGAVRLSVKLILVVVPLVVVFEVLRHLPVFRRAGAALDPLMRGVGLTQQAAVPLFTGLFLGLAYGAGIIIRVSQEKRLPPRELFLVALFLATCHSVVEDILIFAVIGGSAWVMLGTRLFLAVGLTALAARLWKEPPDAANGGSAPVVE